MTLSAKHRRRRCSIRLNMTWRMGVGHMFLLQRRYAQAVDEQLKVLEMDSRFWLSHWYWGMAFEQVGDLPHAVESLQRADDFSGGNPLARGVLG